MVKEIIADLHIHSRFSRACSNKINVPNLVKWARVKGVGLLGTGDFTHPEWLSELKELREENGLLYYEDFPFILSSEVSLIYTQDGKGRRVHLVYLSPSLEVVDKINQWLDTKGRRDYDGRPIFGISCRDFVAKMQEIDDRIEVIPAHIWTPWFGIFGSKTGFDSLKEAFGDKIDRIHAIETGLSSDPEMNWKIKELNDISIVSFSDSHSFWPWRMGRESTIFILKEGEKLSYDLIIKQIRENSFKATVEVDPAYGKYHYDGHRNCGFSCNFEETRKLNGKCPKCDKPLIVGVEYRVEELADQSVEKRVNKKPFYTLLPLHELIALAKASTLASKKTWQTYNQLIEKFENEFNILLYVDKQELARALPDDEQLVQLIIDNRVGNIKVRPGFDGQYGSPLLKERQTKLI
jgi:uncharacterized protein (TIGR00375 family)